MSSYNGFQLSGGVFTSVLDPRPWIDPRILNQAAINASGVIGGAYQLGGRVWHGCRIATDGTVLTLDYPSAEETLGYGINSAGDVVGSYRVHFLDLQSYCFLYSASSFTQIAVPGAQIQAAYGISDSGVIVGEYCLDTMIANARTHGFKRSAGGSFTTIDVPGADSTSVQGINSNGWMCGHYVIGNDCYGFFVDASGTMTTGIDFPGTPITGRFTLLRAINDGNQIVGFTSNGAHALGVTQMGFSTTAASPSTFTNLNIPGGGWVTGLNNAGVIVGGAYG